MHPTLGPRDSCYACPKAGPPTSMRSLSTVAFLALCICATCLRRDPPRAHPLDSTHAGLPSFLVPRMLMLMRMHTATHCHS